jgi:GAF domain-containing protein
VTPKSATQGYDSADSGGLTSPPADASAAARSVRRLSSEADLVARRFARLAVELHEEPGIEETVEAVLQFALQAVRCTHAGVVLARRGRRLETAVATDPVVEQAGRLQIEYGEGPAVTAAAGDGDFSVYVSDTTVDQRWPAWSPRAATLGLRSALAVRLHTGGAALGVLELFHTQPAAFDASDDAVAHILARHASIAVAHARKEASLLQAMDARKLVGQAQGILMERFSVDAEGAFAILRRYSQDNNRKLRDVAVELINTRKLPN